MIDHSGQWVKDAKRRKIHPHCDMTPKSHLQSELESNAKPKPKSQPKSHPASKPSEPESQPKSHPALNPSEPKVSYNFLKLDDIII